ncbi:Arc family DNA-binding protein [Pseudomonas parafulva]|nr:Arc family DNA-binding protein [Pseudomonas parafulva]
MNPIAKDALKRARQALPTSVLEEPAHRDAPAATPSAQAPIPPKEEATMQIVTATPQNKPAKLTGPYTSRNADKFVVRLTDGLRDRIQGYSRRQLCSMNSFIVRAVLKEVERLDRLEGVEPLEHNLQLAELEVSGDSMESIVERLEAAVARLERAQ